jgi:glycosyltransferase involved in cell wall biosynthesis
MKLLIITQKVNRDDPILGFFHRWIEEFAKHVEQLTVICLEEGVHVLPANVRVLSLGKEKGVGKFGRLVRLYAYIWKYRHDYDRVFVHMNPIYVVLCWKLWFVLQKPVFLWYTHKNVDWKLRTAALFVKNIFTASESSLRLKTKKKIVTGHGIDTDFFCPDSSVSKKSNHVLTISRISRTKQIDIMIQALSYLPNVTLEIVGGPVTDDDMKYQVYCNTVAKELNVGDRVVWHGVVTNMQTRDFYRSVSLFINISNTGSLDKTILEAMACGLKVISSNEAAHTIPGVLYAASPITPHQLSEIIKQAHHNGDVQIMETSYVQTHKLSGLIASLIKTMN